MTTLPSRLSLACALAVLAMNAQAASLCSSHMPSAHPDGISVSDMTFAGGNADDCYGVVAGNDNGDNVWNSTGWTLLAKDDTPGSDVFGTVLGITFTLDATPEGGAPSGNWTLSWAQTGTPGYDVTMDVVGVLKAGSEFASYLFEDLTFTADDTGSGTWAINYTNNGGNIADLSHLSLYYKNASHSSSSSGGGGGSSGSQIPEPGMLGLVGIGLLAQAVLLRQRRRRQG